MAKPPLAFDTDVLVHWAMADAPHHRAVRRLVESEARKGAGSLALTRQVLNEFLHVTTDSRRFERPLTMDQAVRISLELWNSREVERISPKLEVHDRVCELLERHRLGRRRILDTCLAATLETRGIRRLASLNGRDFALFDFLEIVDPRRSPS